MPNNDLISRAVAKEAIRKKFSSISDRCEINEVLNGLPAVDATLVIHARWCEEQERTNHWHCGNCGFVEGIVSRFYNYCPNCGAKMDIEEQEAR